MKERKRKRKRKANILNKGKRETKQNKTKQSKVKQSKDSTVVFNKIKLF